RWGDRPILFLTAHTDVELINRAFAAGADDYIRKPIIAPELVTRIISRLDRVRRSRLLQLTSSETVG
ncbi:MAG: response regulator, partial [Thermosynechococcaceae cyanobacterium]